MSLLPNLPAGLPTEMIGSIPRPAFLLQAMASFAGGSIPAAALEEACDRALATPLPG